MTFQTGIHYQANNRKPACMHILFLSATNTAAASNFLATLWPVIEMLKAGTTPELEQAWHADPESVPVERHADRLSVVLGYNIRSATNLYEVKFRRTVSEAIRWSTSRDDFNWELLGDDSPFGNPALSLDHQDGQNPANTDLVLQFTGNTPFVVNHAAVQVQNLLASLPNPGVALKFATSGFSRTDKRSWTGFFDGINNIPRNEREQVITFVPGQSRTNMGSSTFMTFAKMQVDQGLWNAEGIHAQEKIIGRKKLTGVDFTVAQNGAHVPLTAPPPVPGPLQPPHPELEGSHIHRASLNTVHRLFRQGFEYADWNHASKAFDVGLNFVAFHKLPDTAQFILSNPDWLGGVSLGGDSGSRQATTPYVLLRAGGVYIIPPQSANRFPGADMLRAEV